MTKKIINNEIADMKSTMARGLVFWIKNYEQISKTISSMKNRAVAFSKKDSSGDAEYINNEIKNLEKTKDKFAKKISEYLSYHKVWSDWLDGVPGIGPALGGKLLSLYYYKSVAVCDKCGKDLIRIEGSNGDHGRLECSGCGKKSKGDGVLNYRIEDRDFSTISKWWKFMGRHTVDGKMPKRKKGVKIDWRTDGRTCTYLIAEQFVKNGNKYRKFYDKEKAKIVLKRPDATKGHINNMAKHNTIQLFLSHFWLVARTIDGKSVTDPYYAVSVLGHNKDHIIEPYYWDGN